MARTRVASIAPEFKSRHGSRPANPGTKLSEMSDTVPDGEREVRLGDETDIVVLPDQTSDDLLDPADRYESSNDERLLEDRPPHW